MDSLTGLANHRAFHERLHASFVPASGRAGLALVVIDIDNFRVVNDCSGHGTGDRVLCAVADQLRDIAQPGDTVARVGGDEFALLLPGRTAQEALALVERARTAIAETRLLERRTIRVSAGICDLQTGRDPDSLLRLAGGALYWIKRHGRDAACVYDPRIVLHLPADDRTCDVARSQAVLGIRALARAIDAKDPTTRRHSDRVASLARRIALGLGWTPERVSLLEHAALVHDIGKIGIPDSVLFKPGPLDPEEYEAVKQHAALGAEITRDILEPEQVAWIRGHHERPDGRGYPDGLAQAEIPDGAAILAVADAFDVMTIPRPYGHRKDLATALSECVTLAGSQFAREPVRALAAVLEQRDVPWVATVAVERAVVEGANGGVSASNGAVSRVARNGRR